MENSFENQIAVPQKNATTEMMISRESQQVQVAMLAAKRFPRDEVEAYNRILRSCQRKSLAEVAIYSYPRGGEKVTGPSIRLAEAIAQNWGNMEFGVRELEQKNGASTVEAFAWDLETNTKQSRIFEVKHERATKKDGVKKLTDPRDIYEMIANQGSRRVRACILSVVPGDVIEAALNQCKMTLTSGNGEPLIDRVRKMAKAFQDKYGVTLEMIEQYVGYSSESFGEDDFLKLIGVFNALKEGGKKEDYFEGFKKEKEPVKTDAASKAEDEFKNMNLEAGKSE